MLNPFISSVNVTIPNIMKKLKTREGNSYAKVPTARMWSSQHSNISIGPQGLSEHFILNQNTLAGEWGIQNELQSIALKQYLLPRAYVYIAIAATTANFFFTSKSVVTSEEMY